MYTNDDILAKAKELGKMMAETEAVEFFKRAEAQIHENQNVREKMASLKSLQKQAVNFQNYGKEKALGMVEEKIANVEAELDEMPIVDQFKEAQGEVNALLQMVSHAISQTVTDEIIVSTGGDLLSGETGAATANSTPGKCS
ncbi:RicAFT regulatory complex protein RicA family protein [Macrococcoides bohemicum]|uniref:RicAFT regulatory complex protein RicA family protein n=1 Tax=Macrococcoides bohemicum TaxID=1903056 RepID=A0AAJ4P8Z1_9STAP|nr:RicAFT regulatory complex protein RicA family protein [Macrococcus bohemicus]QYA41236.1 RicAFT regulatory complex protein RicA family protein [Macrococcus bohemicus]QYA43667.1 RicAFT regulatory complex protein RicA family protein [Macrococcus bohemicus]